MVFQKGSISVGINYTDQRTVNLSFGMPSQDSALELTKGIQMRKTL